MILVEDIDQNTPEWLDLRKGKITGTTKVTEFSGNKFLKGFWEILADRLVLPPEQVEEPRDRGHRLEEEGIRLAAEKLGVELYDKKVAMCISEDNPNLAYSPDWLAKPVDGKFYADFEHKGFEGPAHIQSVIEGYIPDKTQMLRPFTVNPDLKERYYVFYHDRITVPELSLHIITISREDYEEEIEILAERDKAALKKIDEILLKYF